MSETRINFTKEHQDRLSQLAGEALIKGTIFKGGSVGNAEVTVYDLFHNCTVQTLSRYQANLKKEVREIDDLDEFLLTPHQKQKKSKLEKQRELMTLIIGYKRFQEQTVADRKEYLAIKSQYDQLKENSKTPEDRLKELEAKMAGFSNMEAEPVAD
jgi:hypothetical protein